MTHTRVGPVGAPIETMSLYYTLKRTGTIPCVLAAIFATGCSETTAPGEPVLAGGGASRGLAVGSVRDANGRSVSGANIYVGTFRSSSTGSCSSFSGARTVERGVTDGSGGW